MRKSDPSDPELLAEWLEHQREGHGSPKERREILDLFREGLSGYTYFES